MIGIDFDAEYQDDIVRTIRNLSDLMRERNIELPKSKELLCGGKIDDNGKAFIKWKSLQDEFINVERGDREFNYCISFAISKYVRTNEENEIKFLPAT